MKRRREEKEVCKENTQLHNKNVIQVHYGKIYGCIVENIYGSIIEIGTVILQKIYSGTL